MMNPLQVLTNILTSTGLKVAGSIILAASLVFLIIMIYEMTLRIQRTKQEIKLNKVKLKKI